uniref:Neurogenic locus notch protein 2 n=1 Tax=Echinococcus granulosus TaxID=6210 RepID=A0A068WJR3_ECHGR|nr:neurogenic locus notch protein 2 [Echinococcus granulosus]
MLIKASLLLFLLASTPASSNPVGTLEIEMTFSNEGAKLPNGENCDTFPWNFKCDVFFIICITEESSTRRCNLHYEKTHPVRNTGVLSKSVVVNYTSDQTIKMTVTIMDHDLLSSPDLIAEYTYSFLPSALVSQQNILPTSTGGAHPSTEMRMWVRRRCKPNHFGSKCTPCGVIEGRGFCDSDGLQTCHPGYFGPKCSQFDFCSDSPPCAPFAVCENTEDSFRCLCDGTSGKRCELGFDPCEEHICHHNGTCTAVGVNRNFAECVNCSIGWSGLHCRERVDACAQEEKRLGRLPCANGGHCVNRMNGTVLTCLCADGWRGARCETSLVKASAIVAVVTICLLALLAGCIFTLVRCFRVYLLPKLRLIVKKQRSVEMQPVKVDSRGELWRANNLYEEMGTQCATAKTEPQGTADLGPPPSKTYPNRLTKAEYSHFSSPPFSVNDDDYEDYETMDIQQHDPTHTCFKPTPSPESVDGEEYEPVSMRAHDGDLAIQALEAGSVCVNNEDYEELTKGAVNRPLPAPQEKSNRNENFC